jgi:CBS domain-containing protein
MEVEKLMTSNVKTCRATESLAAAARIMWENDCGSVPVVDDEGRLIGMITDRDVCMSSYLSGCSVASLEVSNAMCKTPHACRPADPIEAAEHLMEAKQVRRLPVVDAEERVIGILSLNDIARDFGRKRGATGGVTAEEVARTLSAVCQPHGHAHMTSAA